MFIIQKNALASVECDIKKMVYFDNDLMIDIYQFQSPC